MILVPSISDYFSPIAAFLEKRDRNAPIDCGRNTIVSGQNKGAALRRLSAKDAYLPRLFARLCLLVRYATPGKRHGDTHVPLLHLLMLLRQLQIDARAPLIAIYPVS